MKKYYIALFFVLLLVFGEKPPVEACESPYTEHIIQRWYQNGDLYCPYWIVYCCWWDNVNNKLGVYFKEVRHWSSCKVSANGWNDFREWMANEIMADAVDNCAPDFPPCDPPPPVTVELRFSRCHKYRNFYWDKYPNEAEWMLAVVGCYGEAGICKREYIVCTDYSQNPPDIITLFDDCYVIGQPGCSWVEPQIPPPGKDFFESWETECFARPCCP